MNFRSPIVLIIFAVAVLGTIGWAYYDNKIKNKSAATTQTTAPAETKISNLTNLDPADFDTAVSNQLALASQKAQVINPDYQISAVEVTVDKDLAPQSVNIRYIYSAANDITNNWMITIAQSSGSFLRALVPKEDYLGNLTQIDTKLWKYNYVTALQLAEKAGGQGWRESNTLTGVKLTLRHTIPNNWLLWIVEYDSADSNYIIKLDANSGKIVTE